MNTKSALTLSLLILTTACGGLLANNEVATFALETAQANSQVTAALGDPIEIDGLISGSIERQGISGEAVLQIPISGPNGEATLHVGARLENGLWEFYTLTVELDDTGEFIPLQ